MSFDRGSTLIVPPSDSGREPRSRTGFVIAVIILIILVIALLIVVIVLAVRKQNTVSSAECTTNQNCSSGKICTNGSCVTYVAPVLTPNPVTIAYDSLTGAATVTWAPVTGITSYHVYRKLEDPSVSVNNYDSKQTIQGTSTTFTSLAEGTHYFVVTSVNSGGESQPSSPVILAPSCGVFPVTMPAPTVTETANNCSGVKASDQVSVAFTNMSIPNGVYVVQGTGQAGSISQYLYLVQGNAFGPATQINLTCGSTSTNHTVTQITQVSDMLITVNDAVTTTGAFTMTWRPMAGAERYVVWLTGVNANGVSHYYGGFANANDTALTIQTNPGDTLVYGLVLGYRICNQSSTSPVAVYVTPT